MLGATAASRMVRASPSQTHRAHAQLGLRSQLVEAFRERRGHVAQPSALSRSLPGRSRCRGASRHREGAHEALACHRRQCARTRDPRFQPQARRRGFPEWSSFSAQLLSIRRCAGVAAEPFPQCWRRLFESGPSHLATAGTQRSNGGGAKCSGGAELELTEGHCQATRPGCSSQGCQARVPGYLRG